MAAGSNEPNDAKSQADQLVDLLVYAPVGLIYEYGEVLPQLDKRGKSQVQLAKVMGQMAAKQGQKSVDDALLEAAGTLAKGITEFGTLLGLAPDANTPPPPAPADAIDVDEVSADQNAERPAAPDPAKTKTPSSNTSSTKKTSKAATSKTKPSTKKTSGKKSSKAAKGSTKQKKSSKKATSEMRLPIARYDDLTAREIVPLLDDLSAKQRARIREHEMGARNRKTILAKLDRLD